MVRYLIAMLFVLSSFNLLCQSEYFVGGELSLASWNSEFASGSKRLSFWTSPKIGIVFNENLYAGVLLSYNLQKVNNNWTSVMDVETKGIGGGLFVRYRRPFGKRFTPYIEASGLLISSKTKFTEANGTFTEDDISSLTNEAKVGVEFSLSSNWILTSHWTIFQHNIFKEKNSNLTSSRASFVLNPENFFIGVWYFFGKDKIQ